MYSSKHPHQSPSVNCSCGFYAQYNGQVLDYRNYGVEGTIQAHGLTIMGTKGIRTQFAQVESLFIGSKYLSRYFNQVGDLGHVYGVPMFTDRGKWLEAFPPQDVSAIAPQSRIKVRGVEIEDSGAPHNKRAHRVTVWMTDGSIDVYPCCEYSIVVKESLDQRVTVKFSNDEGVDLELTDVQISVVRNMDSRELYWGPDSPATYLAPNPVMNMTYNPGRYASYWFNDPSSGRRSW